VRQPPLGRFTPAVAGGPAARKTPNDFSRSRLSGGVASLRPSAIWRWLKTQPFSVWFVLIYLFFEYVRPQTIYEGIAGPPYARIAIILASFSFLLERRKLRFGLLEVLLAVFSFILIASCLTAYQPDASYDQLADYLSWMLIYLLIANAIDTEDKFLVFMFTFLLYSFKMSQHATRSWAEDGFAFRDWGVTGAPGWFQNSGEFGIQMCIFLPLIVAFILALGHTWPRWMRIFGWGVAGTAVTGIVASSSRGALVGLAAVAVWQILKSRHWFRTAVAWAVYLIMPDEQKLRFQASGEDKTSVSRTTYWHDGMEIMNDYPVLGVGYANWPEYYEVHYGVRALPHNIFIQAGAELGYPGLVALLALIGASFLVNRGTRELSRPPGGSRFVYLMSHGLDGAMVGFIASGFFVTVLYYPFFWINLAMTAALRNAARNRSPVEAGVAPGSHWRMTPVSAQPRIAGGERR
jgi:putative inorganic carbon (HCO3(-)) transporter